MAGGDAWAEVVPSDAVPDADGFVRPVVRAPFRRQDAWDRPIEARPGAGALRPVVVEMRVDADRALRWLPPAIVPFIVGLVVVAVRTPSFFLVVIPFALLMLAAFVLLGPFNTTTMHAQVLVPTQVANMRPLPGPRRLESAAEVRRAARRPTRLVVPTYLLPVAGIALALLISAGRGSATSGATEVTGVFPLFLVLGGGLGIGTGVGFARGQRAVATRWEEWEARWGVLLVREPTTLPNGFLWFPRRRVQTPVWSSAARWPPGQAGVGWYWVPRDRVHAGAVGWVGDGLTGMGRSSYVFRRAFGKRRTVDR